MKSNSPTTRKQPEALKGSESESPAPHRRSRAKLLILASELLLVSAVIAFCGLTTWLRHKMRVALPQLDGRVIVAGLARPVRITRDSHGTPSITAESLDDLLFAQGYVTASDRLFQMDLLRRHAAGDLAVLLGPGMIAHDRLQRTLQIRAAADRTLPAMPAEQQHELQVYADGVNAYMKSHLDTLPIEFLVLDYKPEPWRPQDSLLVALSMVEDLSTNFPTKLHRERLAEALPPQLVDDLYPVGSWRDRVPGHATPELTAPQRLLEQIPLDSTQARLQGGSAGRSEPTAEALLATFDVLQSPNCTGCRAGSNDWVVVGSRSVSGRPILSNDMHLSLAVPDVWYQAGLHVKTKSSQSLDVVGFTLPGLPLVIVGRNEAVAWGFTNTGADVQDVIVEHFRGSGENTEFKRPDGEWLKVGHHKETIDVRGGRAVQLDVLTTRHEVGNLQIETPILSGLYPGERRPLSLEWSVYDPTTLHFPLLEVDTATSAAGLIAAFSTFGAPSQNLVAADAYHIAYHAIGRVPVRGPAVQHQRELISFEISRTDEDDAGDSEKQVSDGSIGTQHELDDEREIADIPAPPAPRNYTIGSPLSEVPVDALDSQQIWSGYIPYDQLPTVVDPPSGVLVTANSRVTPDDYPYFLAENWADPYRVERINARLRGQTRLTPADMLHLQTDVDSDFDRYLAQRLAYALDHATTSTRRGRDHRLQQAADLLRSWNGEVSANSSPAAIVDSAHTQLWVMLLSAQLRAHGSPTEHDAAALARLYTWGEKTTALENLLLLQPSRWLPAQFGSWNDLLTAAVQKAISQAPSDLSHWTYAQERPFSMAHPIFGGSVVVKGMLGYETGTGRQPVGGDATTVDATGSSFGPSERFIADLADTEKTWANLTTGESGSPASPFYLDQFASWIHGTTLLLPLNHPQTSHSLLLEPQ